MVDKRKNEEAQKGGDRRRKRSDSWGSWTSFPSFNNRLPEYSLPLVRFEERIVGATDDVEQLLVVLRRFNFLQLFVQVEHLHFW